MNNYNNLKGFLEMFTHNLNFISKSDIESMIKYGQDALYYFANSFNHKSQVKIKNFTVSEASLLMWSQSLVLMSNFARLNHAPDIFDDYYGKMFEIFINYTRDDRFFDTDSINRKVAINGVAEIEYDVNLGTTFCNTASLLALYSIHEGDISDNQNEGMKYIQDYLSTNYLELQFKVAFVKYEFI